MVTLALGVTSAACRCDRLVRAERSRPHFCGIDQPGRLDLLQLWRRDLRKCELVERGACVVRRPEQRRFERPVVCRPRAFRYGATAGIRPGLIATLASHL